MNRYKPTIINGPAWARDEIIEIDENGKVVSGDIFVLRRNTAMMSDTTDEHIKLANRVRDFITLNGSAYHGFDAPAYAHLLADAIRSAEARARLEEAYSWLLSADMPTRERYEWRSKRIAERKLAFEQARGEWK